MSDERGVDQYWLPEGYVNLTMPRKLCQDSFDEFEQLMTIIIRRERRKVIEAERQEVQEPAP